MSLNNPYVNPLAPEEEEKEKFNPGVIGAKVPNAPTVDTTQKQTEFNPGVIGASAPEKPEMYVPETPIENYNKQYINDIRERGGVWADDRREYGRAYADANQQYKQSLDQYIAELANTYEKPLDADEREKREKAATAIGGIGALGNVANAFSNLIFTGKGAPSQTLPERPDFDKEIDKFRADERTKVKNYLANSAAKMAAFKSERDYLATQQQQKANMAMQRQKTEAELAKLAQQMEVYKQQGNKYAFDALASQYKAIQEAAKAENAPTSIALDNDYKQAGINQRNASAYRSRAGAASSLSTAALNGEKLNQLRNGSSINLEVGGNKIARYNPKKVDDTNINQLIGKMPKEVQEAYKIEMRMSGKSIEARRAIQRQYIAEAITQYPDVEVLADRLGIISYDDNVSTSKKSAKKTSTKKGNASSSSKGGFPD